jgi:hypothetical protein
MQVKIGRRTFEVQEVDRPIPFAGSTFDCFVDEDAGTVRLLKTLPEGEKLRLLATAVSEGWNRRVVRLIWPNWIDPPTPAG